VGVKGTPVGLPGTCFGLFGPRAHKTPRNQLPTPARPSDLGVGQPNPGIKLLPVRKPTAAEGAGEGQAHAPQGLLLNPPTQGQWRPLARPALIRQGAAAEAATRVLPASPCSASAPYPLQLPSRTPALWSPLQAVYSKAPSSPPRCQ
jgi:hypothetical protein